MQQGRVLAFIPQPVDLDLVCCAVCFKIYDSNGDGFIFKEEICHMMKHSLIPTFGGEDSEKSIKDLVDEVFKIMVKPSITVATEI